VPRRLPALLAAIGCLSLLAVRGCGKSSSSSSSSSAGGTVDPAAIGSAKTELDKVARWAAAKGKPIPESVPSVAQLSSPPQ
jgi:hypothetical protein